VFRLAALYIVGAWVVLQVADLAFESWDITSSALRYVWLGVILGFPIALVSGLVLVFHPTWLQTQLARKSWGQNRFNMEHPLKLS
jgi:hypothetical protein